ncbi:MAG: branched-chain amino acid ABC transporter permease [Alphaproteobacteria bacterium]|jgi:branched-chain amino acid transport system permease protein
MFLDLLLNALIAGILLGGFYAALSIGLSITFGLLDIVNIAHPTLLILGAFVAFLLNATLGLDPILAGVIVTPVFFVLGWIIYLIYYNVFEKSHSEGLRGLAFFFGLLFIIEVALIIQFGVDHRLVEAPYIGESIYFSLFGADISIPWRLLVAFFVAIVATVAVQQYLNLTFFGRAVRAVAQDPLALRLMGVDPVKVRKMAFSIGVATTAVAGALMIIVIPIEPSVGRLYIGNVFAIVVLGGLGSISGTLYAAIIIGLAESIVATFFGPSWAPAVSFGILLGVLAIRPQGIFGLAR